MPRVLASVGGRSTGGRRRCGWHGSAFDRALAVEGLSPEAREVLLGWQEMELTSIDAKAALFRERQEVVRNVNALLAMSAPPDEDAE